MKRKIGLQLILGYLLLGGVAVQADISGQVFTDYNLNGNLDNSGTIRNFADNMSISTAVDQGVSGVSVQATCVTSSGSSNFSAVSDAQGQFTIATPNAIDGAQNCLLNLSGLATDYTVGSQSTGDANVLTQFVSPNASNVQFTVKKSLSYCQNNPDLATSRYAYGQQTPNAPYAGNNSVTNIFAFPYNSGTAGEPKTQPTGFNAPVLANADPAINDLALAKDVGSIFGLGWHAASKSLFAAAYMKAFTGFGPGGTGAIYRIDVTDPNNPSTSIYADLNAIFPTIPPAIPTAGADPYLTGVFSSTDPGYVQIADGSDSTKPKGSYVSSGNTERDGQQPQISSAVGKTAFGDLDVSNDGKWLYVTNMANRKLYILPLRDTPLTAADASLISSYDIPTPAGCAWGRYLVFGLGEYQNNLYVGSSCSIGGDNAHNIFRFDLNTKQFDSAPIVGYTSLSPTLPTIDPISINLGYGYQSLAISDIVFDSKGNMTIATRAVFPYDPAYHTDKTLSAGYGQVFRACVQDAATHTWTLENNGSCGGVTTKGAGDGLGLGGGRYFYQEWPADQNTSYPNTSFGGAAQVPGFLEAAHTVADPFSLYQGGVAWLDVGLGDVATAGQRKRSYGLFGGIGPFDSSYPDNMPINGKNASLGDLEVLCDTPPVEIGNRVWKDTNGNGLQDEGEEPLAGVKVELFAEKVDIDTVTPLATAITDAQGYYIFSNDMRGYPTSGNNAPNDTTGADGGFNVADIQGGRASSTSHKFGLSSVQPNTNYQVVIRNAEGGSQQAPLQSMLLTATKQNSNVERDSDASLLGAHAISQITTTESTNDHSVDFGFKALSLVDLELSKTIDKPMAKLGETVIFTITLSNNSGTTANAIQVTDLLPSQLSLVTATPAVGTFVNGVWSIPSLGGNSSTTLTLVTSVIAKP